MSLPSPSVGLENHDRTVNGRLELNSKSQLSNSPNTLWKGFGHALAGIGDETAFSYVPLLTISPKRLSHACTHSANPMALFSVPPYSYDRYKPSNWNSDQFPISNSLNMHGMAGDRPGRRALRSLPSLHSHALPSSSSTSAPAHRSASRPNALWPPNYKSKSKTAAKFCLRNRLAR